MDKLNKDELFVIARELNLPSLLDFCFINKRIHEKIYNNDNIWYYKLDKNFLDYKSLNLEIKPKELYIILYFLKIKCKMYQSIQELSESKVLELSYKKLNAIPREIGLIKNVSSLYLSNNELTSIPKEIFQLKNLERINLSHNKLKLIPKELGQLKNLRDLYLNCNELEQLPEEIGLLEKLEELYLSHNNLKSLPKEIGSLQFLSKVDLFGNKSIQIPKEIKDIEYLMIYT